MIGRDSIYDNTLNVLERGEIRARGMRGCTRVLYENTGYYNFHRARPYSAKTVSRYYARGSSGIYALYNVAHSAPFCARSVNTTINSCTHRVHDKTLKPVRVFGLQ